MRLRPADASIAIRFVLLPGLCPALVVAFVCSTGDNSKMDTDSQQLLRTALSLPESDRAQIAGVLINSLEAGSDENADVAWAAEIQRRIASIKNDDVELIPWNTVRDEMRTRQNG